MFSSTLPPELNLQIMDFLTIPELVLITSVDNYALNTSIDLISRKSLVEIIEFIILNPALGLKFTYWLKNKSIFQALIEKPPERDAFRVLLQALVVGNVQWINSDKVRDALDVVSLDKNLLDPFKSGLERSIAALLSAQAQPFFSARIPKTYHLPAYLNLPHVDFTFLAGKYFNFKYAYLYGGTFDFAIVKNADFSFADLTLSRHVEAEFMASKFTSALMRSAKFLSSTLIANDFRGADFDAAQLIHSVITSCDFTEAELVNNVDFSYAKLKDCDFTLAHILRANFFGATLRGLKFIQAQLHEIDFSTCLLSGRFCGLNFFEADIRDCNFYQLDLRDACFMFADLTNVNFSSADLRGADFFGASLLDVNCNNVILPGFNCLDGKFSIKQDEFLVVNENDQCMLNLATILVLEFYASQANQRNEIAAFNTLCALIKNTHDDLSKPLTELIDKWRAIPIFNLRNSFFASAPLAKEITDLIDAIYCASSKVNLLASY